MTTSDVTHIRTRKRTRTQSESTPESARLTELDAQITAVEAKLADPHGWGRELADERTRLLGLRAELVALTATSALAA
jgi:hypothetical protein